MVRALKRMWAAVLVAVAAAASGAATDAPRKLLWRGSPVVVVRQRCTPAAAATRIVLSGSGTPGKSRKQAEHSARASHTPATATSARAGRQARTLAEFDTLHLSVRGGRGGDGRVVRMPSSPQGLDRDDVGEFVPPYGGGRGGDVILYVDTSMQTLLNVTARVEGRPVLKASDGGQCEGLANYRRQRKWAGRQIALCGDSSPTANCALTPYDAPSLRVGVPPGTVVRTSQGRLVADLVAPGDEVVAAEGGAGGVFLFDDPRTPAGVRMSFQDQREMAKGRQGESADLELILRTVADVGFIGFPNAGKSTLLARLTRAKPTIGAYPFTTLIPNVGRLDRGAVATARQGPTSKSACTAGVGVGVGAGLGAGGDEEAGAAAPAPVMVDLPGLIADAHRGRGLGRLFLRHARRCRLLLYVLDTSAPDMAPPDQYRALHRELALYNPDYVARPHVVALNKLDVLLEMEGKDTTAARKVAFVKGIHAVAEELRGADDDASACASLPAAVVGISAKAGKGLEALQAAIDEALQAAPPSI